ncbi:hypothetical protein EHS25_008995 [Saitozyma podzolica]|uniref:Uncharacterized protein n=1 Tax=Saitozyma podzolica TaxID=1890683 RepID=A0A427YKM8_9TREE|nr:hypothetical protein EHS25_008995 [Saitozyma podzolica]
MAEVSEPHPGPSRRDRLVAIPPPLPPSDLVQSALHLPLENITREHRGRKLRTTGQIIHFDIKSSLLILGAGPVRSAPDLDPDRDRDLGVAAGPSRRTVLVNASIPLLGKSPAAKDVSEAYGSGRAGTQGPQELSVSMLEGIGSAGPINRERLRIERGEWICVVGWLEGEVSRRIELAPESGFRSPMELVLEAIHIAPSRPPNGSAIYRGEADVTLDDQTRT